MEKLQFNISIAAPSEKVWDVLWKDETYRAWTSVFGEGSKAVSDWQKGSKVLFLGGDGSAGMVSRIDDLIPNELMSFEHLGEVKDGVEDTTSERVQKWAGAKEIYRLQAVDGNTALAVEIDTADEYKEMFAGLFPKALDKVKELAESVS